MSLAAVAKVLEHDVRHALLAPHRLLQPAMNAPPAHANPRVAALAVLFACVTALAACSGPRTLVMTPYLIEGEGRAAYEERVPAPCCGPSFDVIYVTDRKAAPTPGFEAPAPSDRLGETIPGAELDTASLFSWRRSSELRYGLATVDLRPAATWEDVLERTCGESDQVYRLSIGSIHPVGVMRGLGEWISIADGIQVLLPEAMDGMRGEEGAFAEFIGPRLAATSGGTAHVFVHGFNNTFDHAIFRCAELWHYTGRDSVPIAYCWPAARGGLRGYTYDRESGEFTIVHLKQFLRALMDVPGLKRIDIVAHSRGTDVTVTALRELYIEARAEGEDAVASLKLGSLVLAAPDIDMDVFTQRFGAEMVVNAPERTVIYFSEDDDAIWWARWLFDSVRRLGSLAIPQLSERERRTIRKLPRLQLIDCEVSGFGTSHAYVFSHPAAMSDLIRVLRDRAEPGSPERPLRAEGGAWVLENDYLKAGGATGE